MHPSQHICDWHLESRQEITHPHVVLRNIDQRLCEIFNRFHVNGHLIRAIFLTSSRDLNIRNITAKLSKPIYDLGKYPILRATLLEVLHPYTRRDRGVDLAG